MKCNRVTMRKKWAVITEKENLSPKQKLIPNDLKSHFQKIEFQD